ncbi:hypothetical protein BHM03_00009262 [Ensete ventricosum]|nr:hypothetical protein BHM03_00009262 [Ensete ventricosum]
MSAQQNVVEGWSPVESAREGMVGQRATSATVSIGCSIFDRSVRPSLMQSGRERPLAQRPRSPAEHRRGAVVAAATTRAATRAVSGVAGEEGELSAEKVVTMAGVGEEESGDNNKGCSKEGKLLAKIMVGVGAVDSDVEWRRLRWQRRTQGRKRLLRLGRSATVVADDRSRCGIDDWQPLGYGRGGYVGSSSDRGDNKMNPTEEQREKDQMMPGDRCRSRWFRRQRRQRTGAVGSGRRHQMAAVGSGEEEEHSLGHWHRSMGPTVEEVERAPR